MSKLEIGEVTIDDVGLLGSLVKIAELKRFENINEAVLYVLERSHSRCLSELERASLSAERAIKKYS